MLFRSSLVRYKGSITTRGGYDPVDVWAVGRGDFITITNRLEDVPDWLAIYPTEVANKNVEKMRNKLSTGNIPHFVTNDYENVWKPNISDFIVWVGDPRRGVNSQGDVLGIFRFRAGSVVIQNFKDQTYNPEGREAIKYLNPSNSAKMIEPYNFIVNLGMPRQLAIGWRLG